MSVRFKIGAYGMSIGGHRLYPDFHHDGKLHTEFTVQASRPSRRQGG